MTNQVVLQSQRYLDANYDGNNLKCLCCKSALLEGEENCGICYMPIAISKSAKETGNRPAFIPILGSSGAGKTVFMGTLLDLLSKGKHEISGQPNNAFSIAVQQETMMALERRRFPRKTPVELEEWNWVHCNLEYKNRRRKKCEVDVAAPDLAGEALAMELDHPNSFPVIKNCITKSSGVLLLLDALKVSDHANDEDLMATKIATYVHSQTLLDSSSCNDIPVAVTFTKTDLRQEAADDPHQFAANNLPSFFAYVEKNLPNISFFASSVVGSVTTVSDDYGDYFVPFHVQPKGIIEPLAWIIRN